MPKMSVDTLKAVTNGEIRRAIGYMGGIIATERMKALNYSLGRPFGNEIEGQSSVVSTDVSDVIESILPSLLKIFTSGDAVVKFEPQGPEDEQVADQATDYCNWIFARDNDGFTILYDWIKDALLQKMGTIKLWWDEREEETEEEYEGLTDDELTQLLSDEEIEPIEHTEYPATALGYDPAEPANDLAENENEPGAVPPVAPGLPPQAPAGAPPAGASPSPGAAPGMSLDPGMGHNGGPVPMLHDIKVKRIKKAGKVKIVAIPPEEFLVSPGARDSENAVLMAHRKRTTRSALIEEGYDPKLVNAIPPFDMNTDTTEAVARWYNQESALMGGDTLDPSTEWVFVTECYIRVDYDGDGKAELRKITVGGNGDGGEVLDNEPCDAHPFCFLSPIRTPHVLIGRAVADLVTDIQLINSTLLRGALNNQYLINNPRNVVLDGQVNLDDLLTSRPGGIVRAKSLEAVKPLVTANMVPAALQMLEFMNSVREVRTGVTRYNQGLEADSLNKTASGISQVMNAAQQRIELIARIFAETGVKDMFRKMLHTIAKHQQKARIVRLRNQWVSMDPREWNTSMDVTINVGLGTGNKDQMLGHIMSIMQLQEKIGMAGNPGGIIDPQKIYNAAEKVVENSGLKSADPYFNDPSKVQQQQAEGGMPPPPKPPSPDEIKAQSAMAEAQASQQSMQAKQQLEAAKMQAEMEQVERDRQLAQAKFQVEMAKLVAQMQAPTANTNAVQVPA